MVAIELAKKHNSTISQYTSTYLEASYTLNDKNILIALPITFMNNSGIALKQLVKIYDIPIENIVVIVDEINFPLGKLHLKNGGGDGGHNGISSIISELNSNKFFRLRCGIDKNFQQGGLVDYVLSDFDSSEIEKRDKMIENAIKSIDFIIVNGALKSMSFINSSSLWKDNE